MRAQAMAAPIYENQIEMWKRFSHDPKIEATNKDGIKKIGNTIFC